MTPRRRRWPCCAAFWTSCLRSHAAREPSIRIASPRTNSYKGRKTSRDIVQADYAGIRPETLALPPVLVESEFERVQGVGQDVHGLDVTGPIGA